MKGTTNCRTTEQQLGWTLNWQIPDFLEVKTKFQKGGILKSGYFGHPLARFRAGLQFPRTNFHPTEMLLYSTNADTSRGLRWTVTVGAGDYYWTSCLSGMNKPAKFPLRLAMRAGGHTRPGDAVGHLVNLDGTLDLQVFVGLSLGFLHLTGPESIFNDLFTPANAVKPGAVSYAHPLEKRLAEAATSDGDASEAPVAPLCSHVASSSSWLLPGKQDIALVCEGRSFWTNRELLAARSDYFKLLLCGDFEEGGSSELQVDLQAATLENLLEFLAKYECDVFERIALTSDIVQCCTQCGRVLTQFRASAVKGEVAAEAPLSAELPAELMREVFNLFVAADRFQIEDLKVRCQQVLSQCIGNNFPLVSDTAGRYTSPVLKRALDAWLEQQMTPAMNAALKDDEQKS